MTSITQSFSSRHVPWMKIGTTIDDPDVDAAEAARLGGIDFDVEVEEAGYFKSYEELFEEDGENPLLDVDGKRLYRHPDGQLTNARGVWKRVPSRRAIVRPGVDDWFSFVSTDYQPVQFREAFEFMDGIKPRYVAAGALSDGRQGFMVVQLPDHMRSEVVVNGEDDPHDLYVVLQTSHDLSKGIKIAITTLRNRCMNMLVLPSFAPGVPQSWSIRHVGDPHAKLAQAQQTIANTAAYKRVFEDTVQQLSSVRVTSDDLRKIARRVLPDRLKRREEQVTGIVDRFETADTVGFPETGWGALNAVSEYYQWGRHTASRTAQSEFTSPLEGDTAKYINRTLQLIMAMA